MFVWQILEKLEFFQTCKHYTLHSVHWARHCTMCVQCAMCIDLCNLHCNVQCTVYNVHCTLYITCSLYMLHNWKHDLIDYFGQTPKAVLIVIQLYSNLTRPYSSISTQKLQSKLKYDHCARCVHCTLCSEWSVVTNKLSKDETGLHMANYY